MRTKRFHLYRQRDETGVSGTGIVLDGVRWFDGSITVKWRGKLSSVGNYKSMKMFLKIHVDSHPTNGSRIIWEDDKMEPKTWKEQLEGLSIEDAETFAKNFGHEIRAVEIDGERQHVIMNLKPNRINVIVTNGVIVNVEDIG